MSGPILSSSGSNLPDAKIRTGFLFLLTFVAAMGGLLFGYDWVVIGGAAKFYEAHFHLQDTAAAISANAGTWEKIWGNAVSPVGWAQSCALIGCLIGALASGFISDRFGRKPALIAAAANFVISSVAIAFASSFNEFIIWRILGGLSIGLASTVSPMYISEIAPAKSRGLLVSVNQLTIVIGILAAQIVNWRIADVVPAGITESDFAKTWNVTHGWRWMFAACAAPSVLFFIGALFVPESPRWLAKAGRGDKARAVLARLGGDAYADAALTDIGATSTDEHKGFRLGDLFNRKLAGVLTLGVFLAVFQQWCGINVIFNYAGEIFTQAGFNMNDALTNIVATGSVNLVFTLVALFTVDRLGRRPLMLLGSAGLAIAYVAIGYCYHVKSSGGNIPPMLFLGLVLVAIATYAMSLAPVVWVVISEIFPNQIRGAAMSFSVGALWVACFILTYTFPIFKSQLGADVTFWLYAGVCLVGLVFLFFRLPETKGRSLEDLEKDLGE
jgi:sugar porter (SP) family MFS transporter